MPGLVKRYHPAIAVSVLFCLMIAGVYLAVLRQTDGTFVYPLDDSYIHLALARTLALDHVWGIDATQFASASSSPGWTLLIAFSDIVAGPHLLNGLVLDILFAIVLLFTVDYGLRVLVPSVSVGFRYVTLLAVVFFVPLVSLSVMGMEHVAQTFSILLLLILSVRVLLFEPDEPLPRGTVIGLLATAAFAGSIRYEAVFAIVPVCLCLAVRRRIGLSVLLAVCAAAAPVLFGLYFHHKSGMWLPFSVTVKAADRSTIPASFFVRTWHRMLLQEFSPLAWLCGLFWLYGWTHRRFWHPGQLMLFFAFWITVLHLEFAPTGWLMRYEGYLFGIFIFAVAVSAAEMRFPQGWLESIGYASLARRLIVAVIVILAPGFCKRIVIRARNGIVSPVQASADRYLEHIQMAKFISGTYDGRTVAVNDIGAIAYYSHARLLDIVGLGSLEPARAIHEKHPFTAGDENLWVQSEHAEIAVLQPHWYIVQKILPANWIRVATWRYPRNVVFYGDYEIGFYAVVPEAVPELCRHLMEYRLPAEDKLTYLSPACQKSDAANSR